MSKISEKREEYKKLLTEKASNYKNNTQSDLYFFNNGYAIKIFNEDDSEANFKEQNEKKCRKLKELSLIAKDFPEDMFAFPDGMVILDDKICYGYSMKTYKDVVDMGVYLANDRHYDTKKYLEYAIMSCENLEILHKHKDRICVGDLHIFQLGIYNNKIVFFDTDTFGIESIGVEADVVGVDVFQDPLAYDSAGEYVVKYSQETDYFSMAVIVFKILTRSISPFGGKYIGGEVLSERDRKFRKISILNPDYISFEGIKIIKMETFAWMSIETQKAFIDIFEKDKRFNLKEILIKQLDDLEYSPEHKMYYSKSRYKTCPKDYMTDDEFFKAFSKMVIMKNNFSRKLKKSGRKLGKFFGEVIRKICDGILFILKWIVVIIYCFFYTIYIIISTLFSFFEMFF